MSMSRPTLLLTILALQVSVATGTPYYYTLSGKPKCVVTEQAKNTYLRIFYEAPDITIDKDDPDYGPTYITILEKASMSAVEFVEKDKGRLQRREKDQLHGHPPTSKELFEVKGVIHHRVIEDSEINICIRASRAGSKNPMRFGLRIEELGDDDEQFYKKNSPQPPMLGADAHLTDIEMHMARIESNIHAMLSEADLSKERDSIYHEKTDAMHKATIFWPILHVGILLITGFTQANHIVRFFKTRRII